jgi:hypothetical protein
MSGRPVSNPSLRVSDAERGEVADALKRHCADGRLDTAEFEARLDWTLRAKTRADLAGLLDDLPDLTSGPPTAYWTGAHPATWRHRSALWTLLVVGLVIVATTSVISAASRLATPHVPWVLVVLAAVLIWHRGRGRRRGPRVS